MKKAAALLSLLTLLGSAPVAAQKASVALRVEEMLWRSFPHPDTPPDPFPTVGIEARFSPEALPLVAGLRLTFSQEALAEIEDAHLERDLTSTERLLLLELPLLYERQLPLGIRLHGGIAVGAAYAELAWYEAFGLPAEHSPHEGTETVVAGVHRFRGLRPLLTPQIGIDLALFRGLGLRWSLDYRKVLGPAVSGSFESFGEQSSGGMPEGVIWKPVGITYYPDDGRGLSLSGGVFLRI